MIDSTQRDCRDNPGFVHRRNKRGLYIWKCASSIPTAQHSRCHSGFHTENPQVRHTCFFGRHVQGHWRPDPFRSVVFCQRKSDNIYLYVESIASTTESASNTPSTVPSLPYIVIAGQNTCPMAHVLQQNRQNPT